MSVPVLYDLSRLITRVLNATPNGIDRVDWLLARHVLTHSQFDAAALSFGFTGPRLLSEPISRSATQAAAAAWKENQNCGERSAAYETIVARLTSNGASGGTPKRIVEPRPSRIVDVARALLRYGPSLGASPEADAAKGALYVNAANFPLHWKRHVAWLERRRDIRPVFFVHDLLPLERPDWFWPNEPSHHARRLDLLARRGAAAIVASANVEQALRRHLERLGRGGLPILCKGLPVGEIFSQPAARDPRLAGISFFVACGTIEPRKNHLLLLDVWRELVTQFGADAPRLVIVGNRGWNSAEIVAAVEQEAARGHVIEVAGLPTPDYRILLDHCCALLAPSLAEGFGLPVAEAQAAGAPVIAADIAPFREQGGDRLTYLDPRSAAAWRTAIRERAAAPPIDPASRARALAAPSQAEYLEAFDEFLLRM